MDLRVKRLRPYLYILGTLVFLGLCVDQYNANRFDLQALRWHLQHGFKTGCCGIEVEVPLKYRRDYYSLWGIYLSNMPGRWRKTYLNAADSMVSIMPSRRPPGPDDDLQVEKAKQRFISFGEDRGCKHTADRIIELATRRMECYEFSCVSLFGFNHQNFPGPRSPVWCFGNGWAATFDGSERLRGEFYSMMKTAKLVSQ